MPVDVPEIFAGNSRVLEFVVVDETGAAFNLTGATVKWWLGKNATSTGADVLLTKSIGSGVTIVDPVGGVCEVSLVPNDTKALAPGLLYHEAEVTDAGGNIYTITVGRFKLRPTISPNS